MHCATFRNCVHANVYRSKFVKRYVYGIQINAPCASTGTQTAASSPEPPNKLTATAQGPKSRVCDKKHGIRFLVIAVGLAFICILIVTSIRMWASPDKVEWSPTVAITVLLYYLKDI